MPHSDLGASVSAWFENKASRLLSVGVAFAFPARTWMGDVGEMAAWRWPVVCAAYKGVYE